MIQIAKIQFNPFGENTYILHNGKDAIIVDPGAHNPKELQALQSFVEQNSLTPILVAATHGHIDHVCGAYDVCQLYNVPFAMSSLDEGLMSANPNFAASMGFDIKATPKIAIDLSKELQITLGDDVINVIPTPGHTPGGVALHLPAQNVLLTGDTLFAGSIGRTDLPGGDYNALMNSIIKNLLPLDGTTQILPGHGHESHLSHEAQHNPFINEVLGGQVQY